MMGMMGTSAAVAQAAPATAGRALGTVKEISGGKLAVATDAGQTVAVMVPDGARIQQLAPGSTDLKTASASTADQIAVGDRVLVVGTPGDAGALTATRVVLMKSAAIAQHNQSTQQDWARRGSGGLVASIDPAAKTVSLKEGARTVAVTTTNATMYRRYAPGSVKFEDAKTGTFDDIQAGDQLRVRGDKSPDGSSVTADEIVSGTFKNLAGTIVSVDAAANSLVIKDLSTKKNQTVLIGAGSDLRAMPPEIAARFAAPKTAGAGAARAGAAAGAGAASGAAPAAGVAVPATEAAAGDAATSGARRMGGAAAGRGPGGAGGRGAGSGDLSQVIPRLPKANVADLKAGEALMIVASGAGNAGPFTAITLLTGVEPLLTGPAGSELTIPPWSSSGGGAEGAGASE